MEAMGTVIAVMLIICLAGVVYLAVAKRIKGGKISGRLDQSEWYDSEGNHVYYDRKLIRANANKRCKK